MNMIPCFSYQTCSLIYTRLQLTCFEGNRLCAVTIYCPTTATRQTNLCNDQAIISNKQCSNITQCKQHYIILVHFSLDDCFDNSPCMNHGWKNHSTRSLCNNNGSLIINNYNAYDDGIQ